jgi:hypothetical protein
MNPVHFLPPSVIGLALAAAAVAIGAPIFSEGLRALRLRRLLRDLREAPLEDAPSGFVHVRGRVVLESPLFGPLSGRPCAGFALGIQGVGGPVEGSVFVRRPFRLQGSGVSARVLGARGVWDMEPGVTLEVAPGDNPSEHVQGLLERVPEAIWWRRSGGTLRLTERALFAQSECHVVGTSRQARALELPAEAELLRTGTDGGAVAVNAGTAAGSGEPDLWVSGGEQLDFLLVSDRPPVIARHAVHPLRPIGIVIGPLLTIGGLFYLASAADYLRAVGRF